MHRVTPSRLALLWRGAAPEARPVPATDDAVWLAGDHHVHSRFSVGWDVSTNPPTLILGGDATYPISLVGARRDERGSCVVAANP